MVTLQGTGIQSKFGEKLDSVADLIMVTVLIIILYPIINMSLTITYWIVGIVIIRILSMIIVFIKYKNVWNPSYDWK